jgi:hypothetical protein
VETSWVGDGELQLRRGVLVGSLMVLASLSNVAYLGAANAVIGSESSKSNRSLYPSLIVRFFHREYHSLPT